MTNALPFSSRIYGRLLVLYPEDLRRDFGADMAVIFAEDLDAARRDSGMRGVIGVWRSAVSEFVRFALPSRASSSAVRVPAISLAFSVATLTAQIGVQRTPGPPALFQSAARLLMVLLTFATPLIGLASVWGCRGSAVVSLDLSSHAGEET